MSKLNFVILCISLALVIVDAQGAEPVYEVTPASEVEWEHLNPARGDASPRAGTLWGDRKGTEPTGFLAKFADGFSSPPHIHNVSYRGVVISGLVHNDDPDAAPMWMPAGSFWTQPAGEIHITAASGDENVAIIEIEEGPYLVKPIDQAFDNGERPINVDASNIVWVALDQEITGDISSHGSTFRAVVIQGRLEHQVPGSGDTLTLDPGSYFGSKGEAAHQVSSPAQKSILYISAGDPFDVVPTEAEK